MVFTFGTTSSSPQYHYDQLTRIGEKSESNADPGGFCVIFHSVVPDPPVPDIPWARLS